MSAEREAMNAAERDPFANDVLERLTRSNVGYQREHGNYIVPLASRLLESRARVTVLEAALTEVQRLLLSGHQDSRREALDTIGAALASTGEPQENCTEDCVEPACEKYGCMRRWNECAGEPQDQEGRLGHTAASSDGVVFDAQAAASSPGAVLVPDETPAPCTCNPMGWNTEADCPRHGAASGGGSPGEKP